MEKYEEAAESRFDDWEILSKGENRRKACSIHLGGIYIECLLKGMLCSQCSVTAGTNISQWIINGHTQKRPGHGLNINIYTSYLSDVYDDMSEDMLEALEYLDSPEGIGYIDYRYISEDEVDDQVFQKWMEKFIIIFGYLEQKSLRCKKAGRDGKNLGKHRTNNSK